MPTILKFFWSYSLFGAIECISQCSKFEHCILTRTVKLKKKRFYDVILFWSVNCTKIIKKIVDISEKFSNTLRFPKMYNNCFGQKNRAGFNILTIPDALKRLTLKLSLACLFTSLIELLKFKLESSAKWCTLEYFIARIDD